MAEKQQRIRVKGIEIVTFKKNEGDYISLTDIARYKDIDRSDYVVQNWMRTRSTIEFLGLWEKLNNPNFNSIEFDGIKNESGINSFVLTPKNWITKTKAIGIVSTRSHSAT
ncbi:MAG: hypothetical protein COU66_04175 [Candidatus Pacebacteria bacterium CG10_big_fil_rev_8_21_14_0_10_44_11]|nr:MAG: hypothetical protein COU66_04175 [Candidatus Pacebacteria bacterium CG10_big_fil_rev_8_21_14_0_10_44_11]